MSDQIKNIVEQMRQTSFIKERVCEGNVSAFNFSRQAFYKKEWNDLTTTARGLFIDTNFYEIKARSYDKFFNLNERPETKEEYILDNWTYPVQVYFKENGYLGICSWDINGSLFCASKSTTDSWFALRFRELLMQALEESAEAFSQYLFMNDLSAVFEVIDPIHDPHIIEYSEPKVVLLDLVQNDIKFHHLKYGVLKEVALRFGLNCKDYFATFHTPNQLKSFLTAVKNSTFAEEGFVLEDAAHRYVKVKTPYYNFWKSFRPMIAAVRQGKEIKWEKYDVEKHPEILAIYDIIKETAEEYYAAAGKDMDIITLRNLWRKQNG